MFKPKRNADNHWPENTHKASAEACCFNSAFMQPRVRQRAGKCVNAAYQGSGGVYVQQGLSVYLKNHIVAAQTSRRGRAADAYLQTAVSASTTLIS
jgi:hypothetical protein